MKFFSRRAILLAPWRLVLLCGIATGCVMAGLGLSIRIGGAIPWNAWTDWFGLMFFAAMGFPAGRIGWMLVLAGTFWIAALSALIVRNRWGAWSTAAAGLISTVFFPGGTLTGIIVLAALAIRLIRARIYKPAAKAGGPSTPAPPAAR